MWKFDAVRMIRANGHHLAAAKWAALAASVPAVERTACPGWRNVTIRGTMWQVGIRRWAWKRGTWPAPERPLFRFWLVGWLEVRRFV